MARISTRAPLVRGLQPIAQSIARTASQINRGFTHGVQAPTPQQAYTGHQTTLLIGGYAAKVVPIGGSVTVMVGPQGVGTVWYPQAIAVSTTTGAADNSTCAAYLSPLQNGSVLAPITQIVGQSYAAGGDTIGIAVPPLWPGYFLIVVWTGAHVGDLAAMTVYGSQSALVAS